MKTAIELKMAANWPEINKNRSKGQKMVAARRILL